jgi:flagellar FliL protein
MVVRMAEDRKKEEAKQKLRFFKNGKDKAEADTAPESDGPAQAVAVDDTAPENSSAEPAQAARPSAGKAESGADKPAAGAARHKAAVEEAPEDAGDAATDDARPAAETAAAAAPGEAAPKSRKLERVPAQGSEPESKETLMSQLLPSLTLGFRTLVILAIIVADAFAAYMLTTKVIAPKLIESKVVDLKAEIGEMPPPGGVLPAGKPAKPARGPESVGTMFQVKDIVINPSGTNGTRYLCTTVAFEIRNPLVEQEATAREAQVRDLLIEILSRRSVAELSSLEMRDNIRDEIENSVNNLLTSGDVDGVYFSNFVLQ